MATQTCCACRWAGTVATSNGTCPRCGEKCFQDNVRFVPSFRAEIHATHEEPATEVEIPVTDAAEEPLSLTEAERADLPAFDHAPKKDG